eukprot:CAMPEP_0203747814 /NCGR_PEP_ID=MMETSP0098-20131031/2866_1 /ASSEMBLY_ACC=CAM_ASM_000208 /TAXON_ID=96639 /ORGANISM=" , Strain NY0313808BC1" /LENGTH=751 /DNA_ID=CAMNT_0050636373 /DNA_START=1356 /DNA_END=3611 /DNA_ORIENTATION=-
MTLAPWVSGWLINGDNAGRSSTLSMLGEASRKIYIKLALGDTYNTVHAFKLMRENGIWDLDNILSNFMNAHFVSNPEFEGQMKHFFESLLINLEIGSHPMKLFTAHFLQIYKHTVWLWETDSVKAAEQYFHVHMCMLFGSLDYSSEAAIDSQVEADLQTVWNAVAFQSFPPFEERLSSFNNSIFSNTTEVVAGRRVLSTGDIIGRRRLPSSFSGLIKKLFGGNKVDPAKAKEVAQGIQLEEVATPSFIDLSAVEFRSSMAGKGPKQVDSVLARLEKELADLNDWEAFQRKRFEKDIRYFTDNGDLKKAAQARKDLKEVPRVYAERRSKFRAEIKRGKEVRMKAVRDQKAAKQIQERKVNEIAEDEYKGGDLDVRAQFLCEPSSRRLGNSRKLNEPCDFSRVDEAPARGEMIEKSITANVNAGEDAKVIAGMVGDATEIMEKGAITAALEAGAEAAGATAASAAEALEIAGLVMESIMPVLNGIAVALFVLELVAFFGKTPDHEVSGIVMNYSPTWTLSEFELLNPEAKGSRRYIEAEGGIIPVPGKSYVSDKGSFTQKIPKHTRFGPHAAGGILSNGVSYGDKHGEWGYRAFMPTMSLGHFKVHGTEVFTGFKVKLQAPSYVKSSEDFTRYVQGVIYIGPKHKNGICLLKGFLPKTNPLATDLDGKTFDEEMFTTQALGFIDGILMFNPADPADNLKKWSYSSNTTISYDKGRDQLSCTFDADKNVIIQLGKKKEVQPPPSTDFINRLHEL